MREGKKKMRFKKPEASPIQWNEGSGEYELKCPCGKTVYSPNLKLMPKMWKQHGKSGECNVEV